MNTKIYSKFFWNQESQKFEEGILEIEDSVIKSMEFGNHFRPNSKKADALDYSESYIGPSAIDLHVHCRDFEESHKENFDTLEASAIKGGVAALACMANTKPRLDSVQKVEDFLVRASSRKVRMIPFAAVTRDLLGVEPTDWENLLRLPVAGLSDDGKPLLNEKIFRSALRAIQKSGKILSLHEEDTRISKGSLLHLSETSMRCGLEGSPSEAESSMVERDLEFAREAMASIHFGHLSSQKSVHLLRLAREKNIAFSAELTPHHGLLDVSVGEEFGYDRLSTFKVCPPIRAKEDRESLIAGVREGVIDCFASDHAPHSEFEKDLPYDQASHGMISLEYLFPLYNELRLQAKLPWTTFFRCLNTRPAELLGFGKAYSFTTGAKATFLVFDPNAKQTLKWRLSRSSNTPFEAKVIRGRVLEHYIDGKSSGKFSLNREV